MAQSPMARDWRNFVNSVFLSRFQANVAANVSFLAERIAKPHIRAQSLQKCG
jgi:hypothetical protein